MSPAVCLQNDGGLEAPDPASMSRWAGAALAAGGGRADAVLTIRIVPRDEMAALNQRYRHKTGPTNVLSFPADLPDWIDEPELGDIVICAPVVADEAQAQGKQAMAHWAHMVVHGVLHLLGHDHHDEHDAAAMERLESELVSGFGFPDPWTDATTTHNKSTKISA